jgi:hypothetical protein
VDERRRPLLTSGTPSRQEVDQLDQKLDRHREGSAKLETLPLGRRNR